MDIDSSSDPLPSSGIASRTTDEATVLTLWGEVEEATERRAKRRMEFDAAVRVLEIVWG